MGDRIYINFGALSGMADLDGAAVVLGEKYDKNTDLRELNINISDDSKKHHVMMYTTDLETLGKIFHYRTLRSSSLANANLNDPMEKQRVGVEKFAKNRFITCFCHVDYEMVPFWMYYGKEDRKTKIMMRFQNFASNLENCIYTDYAFVPDNKKCLFKGPKVAQMINEQYIKEGPAQEFDLRNRIDAIMILDVDYVPCDSDVFRIDNTEMAEIDFSRVSKESNAAIEMKTYDPTVLGKVKSNAWEYEKETRILCTLPGMTFPGWEYIDLRLKSEMFRGLHLILSPWDDGNLKEKVESIVYNSTLPEEIKQSILIKDSAMKGKINIPE